MKTPTHRLLATVMSAALVGLTVPITYAGVATVPCPTATGGRAFFVGTGSEGYEADIGQQVTTYVGQPVEVHLKIKLSDGTVQDVSEDDCASFSSGGHGAFSDEYYTPGPAEANKAFPLYAFYQDMCNGTTWTFTVHLVVRPASDVNR